MVLSAEGQKRPAGRDPPFQDHVTAGVRIGDQYLLRQTASVEATDGKSDLGAPEVHAQDYLHPTSDRTAGCSALF
jgi:hypothetical protein